MINFGSNGFIDLSRLGFGVDSGGFDPDALTYFTAAGITDATQKSAVNTFITTVKGNNSLGTNIYAKGVDAGVYLSGDGTIDNALKKLKYPGSFSTSLNNGASALVNGDYSTSLGVTASAVNRKIDTQVIPTDNGLSNNNYCQIVGMVNVSSTTGSTLMQDNKVSGNSSIYCTKVSAGMNGGVLQNSAPQILNQSYFRGLNSDSTVRYYDGFCNLRPTGTAASSVTMDTSISVFAGRNAGTNSFGTGSVGFHWISSSLTDAEYKIVVQAARTMMKSLGRIPITKDVVFFGDSLTFGTTTGTGVHVSTDKFTYLYSHALGLQEQNCGIGGSGYRATVSGILGGYPRRADLLNYNIAGGGKVVISYATNDCRNDTGSGTPASILDYKTKLITFCQELKAIGVNASDIILVGTPLLNDGTTQARQDAWTLGTLQATQAEGVYYVDMNAYMTANGGTSLLQTDNVHLTIAGNTVFYNGLLTAAAV